MAPDTVRVPPVKFRAVVAGEVPSIIVPVKFPPFVTVRTAAAVPELVTTPDPLRDLIVLPMLETEPFKSRVPVTVASDDAEKELVIPACKVAPV